MRATTAGDGPRALSVYDDVVATVVPLWHEWFQARLRLADARPRRARQRGAAPVGRRARGGARTTSSA